MRRIFILLLLIFTAWGVVTAVFAQTQTPPPPDDETPEPTWSSLPPGDQSLLLEAVALEKGMSLPLGSENAANDSCISATEVDFSGTAVGGTTNVTSMTQDVDDPELSCMWGNPQSPQGFRTVWYSFSAPRNGSVTIDTVSSNYDTVVGVFTGLCGSLTAVACNDDFTGFSSRVTFNIKQGETYYVVIADWNASGTGTKTLNAFMQSEPIDSQWQQLQPPTQPPARTGAAAVSFGSAFYQFGGQTSSGNISGDIYRYETSNHIWTKLTGLLARRYFSAARVGTRIYLPGGDTSADTVDAAITNAHVHYDLSFPSPSPISLAPLPVPVAWSQSIAVSGDNTGYYVIGGLGSKWDIYPTIDISETVTAYNNVWKYNIGTNQWAPGSTTMLTPRFGHTAAFVDGRICVMGGLNNNLEMLVSGECWLEGGASSFIPSTKIPRYGAASAVAPDGRWFIFGGLDSTQTPVSEVEVWDPNLPNPGWQVLDVSFDLGDGVLNPPRTRPQGGFIGFNLFAFGGGTKDANVDTGANPIVERLFTVGGNYNYLPIVLADKDDTFDDNFEAARPIAVNTAQNGRFFASTDFFSAYTFQVNTFGRVQVHLTHIPSGSDSNLYLYNSNKELIGVSENGGSTNEAILLTLTPGRYYVMVQRIFGPFDANPAFRITVSQ